MFAYNCLEFVVILSASLRAAFADKEGGECWHEGYGYNTNKSSHYNSQKYRRQTLQSARTVCDSISKLAYNIDDKLHLLSTILQLD